jgi:hypothetical protein
MDPIGFGDSSMNQNQMFPYPLEIAKPNELVPKLLPMLRVTLRAIAGILGSLVL